MPMWRRESLKQTLKPVRCRARGLHQTSAVLSDDDTAVSEEGASETSSAITIVTRQLYLDGLSRYDYDGSGGSGNGGGGGPGSGGDHGTVDVTVGQGKVGVEVEGTLAATVISAHAARLA